MKIVFFDMIDWDSYELYENSKVISEILKPICKGKLFTSEHASDFHFEKDAKAC